MYDQSQTDSMLHQLNNQVQIIPSMDSMPSGGASDEKMWDLRTGQQHQPQTSQKIGLQRIPTKKPGSGIPQADVAGPTPGEQVRKVHTTRQIQNPYNVKTRGLLSDKYGVQLPEIPDRKLELQVGYLMHEKKFVELQRTRASNIIKVINREIQKSI